ncbi:hypothetical protein A7982_12135 [Minicystis rosea]|nr:hypothetical protein A7982_12135 [Minicystis rosea]
MALSFLHRLASTAARRSFWMASLLLVTASCGGDLGPDNCGDVPVTAQCSAALDRESACHDEGGCWMSLGNASGEGCVCPTTDGGKACSRRDDCQSACVIDAPTDTMGQCATHVGRIPGGCQLDEDGKPICTQA